MRCHLSLPPSLFSFQLYFKTPVPIGGDQLVDTLIIKEVLLINQGIDFAETKYFVTRICRNPVGWQTAFFRRDIPIALSRWRECIFWEDACCDTCVIWDQECFTAKRLLGLHSSVGIFHWLSYIAWKAEIFFLRASVFPLNCAGAQPFMNTGSPAQW